MFFVPDYPILIAFIAAVVLLNITPGPDMTFFISRTLTRGRSVGFAALFGTTIGILTHTILVAFGLSALIATSPGLFIILKIAGALYLAFLAISALFYGSPFQLDSNKQSRSSLWAIIAQGIAINLLNPKIALFFITFLPQFVSTSDPHATTKLLFLGILFAILGLCTMSPLVLIAEKFALWMKQNPRITRFIDYLFAGIFSAFAIRLLFARP